MKMWNVALTTTWNIYIFGIYIQGKHLISNQNKVCFMILVLVNYHNPDE